MPALLLPGARKPLALTVTAPPIVPLPPKVPPFTATAPVAAEELPLMRRVPLETVVVPV